MSMPILFSCVPHASQSICGQHHLNLKQTIHQFIKFYAHGREIGFSELEIDQTWGFTNREDR